MALTKVTRNYQVTIPASVRQLLRIRVGSMIDCTVEKGKVVLKPKIFMDDEQSRAARLGNEILEAEKQIRRGKTVPWSEVKRRHGL